MKIISANIVDPHRRKIFPGRIHISDGIIKKTEITKEAPDRFIMPGMVDSHVHIESSMMSPLNFSRFALKHGTVSVIADPHEIANVLGTRGIEFMVDNAKQSPLKIFFGAPSCVPATPSENSGAAINAVDIEYLLDQTEFVCLAEMMNFPGVLNKDSEVREKLQAAKRKEKPADGHAPGLSGKALKQYVSAGITTDHEATNIQEAEEKIRAGMYIQIREGSAAKDFENLIPLAAENFDKLMFCTDDCHPDTLAHRHILHLLKRAVKLGYDLFDLLHIALLNPKKHYKLPVGSLREGDPADFIMVNNLKEFKVLDTYINGESTARFISEQNRKQTHRGTPNYFKATAIKAERLKVASESGKMRVIQAEDRQLFTKSQIADISQNALNIVSDTNRDILKMIVLNRYQDSHPAIAFIRGFGLKHGALASSISHDSHNIIALGVSDEDISKAVNHLIEQKGGILACNYGQSKSIPLEIAGLMTHKSPNELIDEYLELKEFVKNLGCNFESPFMTLSFMALPVIPELKLSDTGLFDVNAMNFTRLFV